MAISEDSQSSNPGSIPGSATIQSPPQRNLTESPTKQKKLPVFCDSFYETPSGEKLLSNNNAFHLPFSPGAQERFDFRKPRWRIIGDDKPKTLRTRLDFIVFSGVQSATFNGELQAITYVRPAVAYAAEEPGTYQCLGLIIMERYAEVSSSTANETTPPFQREFVGDITAGLKHGSNI